MRCPEPGATVRPVAAAGGQLTRAGRTATLRGDQPTCGGRSADLVLPAHGRAVPGIAERLELVVPVGAQQAVDLTLQRVRVALALGDRVAQAVLVDHGVA